MQKSIVYIWLGQRKRVNTPILIMQNDEMDASQIYRCVYIYMVPFITTL